MEALVIKEIVKAVNGTLLYGDGNERVTSVSTNSKEIEKGALFVPIIGEKVDAHDFIDDVFLRGAGAVFTSKSYQSDYFLQKDQKHAYIQVKDTKDALQLLASYYRNRFKIPVIGITGSVGKTSTKEMIAAALMTNREVLKTAGNMNSQVGLPLMVFQIEEKHQVAILEMGMSEEGEMKKLAKVAKPTMAVITNIGVSHIASLGSRENIRKEKMNIISEFHVNTFPDGINQEGGYQLLVNGDDDLLSELLDSRFPEKTSESNIDLTKETRECFESTQVEAFALDATARYKAENIHTKDGKTYFTYVYPGGREDIVLSVLGKHNVSNAICALTIAGKLGIVPSKAKEGLSSYQPISMRGQISIHHGIQIIDDTYNASPDSMKSCINVLLELEGVSKRIAVLADVLELGEASYACHYGVGEYIASLNLEPAGGTTLSSKTIDLLVTVGKEARAIAKAVNEKNQTIKTESFEDNGQAISYLKSVVKAGDALMVKGSRGMHTDEIVEAMK